MKITVETVVNNPEDIKQWNSASGDWHTPRSTVDLREGGKFVARMESKDGAEGFDENPPEVQRQGWQAILDNFAQHVEEKS